MLFIITNISVMACLHNQRHFIVTDKYRGSQVGEKCLIPILIGLSASLIFSCDEQLYKSCFPSVCVSVRYVFFVGHFFRK